MGKVANAKRKKFFEELKAQDQKKFVAAESAKKLEQNKSCCLYKHKDLPGGFRKCINCPV